MGISSHYMGFTMNVNSMFEYTRPGKHIKKLLKMAIEIVSFPIENGDFP